MLRKHIPKEIMLQETYSPNLDFYGFLLLTYKQALPAVVTCTLTFSHQNGTASGILATGIFLNFLRLFCRMGRQRTDRRTDR